MRKVTGKPKTSGARHASTELVDPSKNPAFTYGDNAALQRTLGTDQVKFGDALGNWAGFYEGGLGRETDPYAQEGSDILSRYKGIADKYSNPSTARSADVSSYLDQMRAGLAGYSSPELQGMREQAQKGIDTQYQTSVGQTLKAQSRAGVRGASALAQQQNLERQRIGSQQDLEQGLFVKNADEKWNRLNQYGQAVQGVETNEYNKMLDTTGQYSGQVDKARTSNQAMQQFNLDRLAAEKSGRAATMLSGVDMAEARRRAKMGDARAQQMIDTANSLLKKGRGTEASNLMIAASQSNGSNSGN